MVGFWVGINKKPPERRIFTLYVAEAQGFEPWMQVLAHILP